MTNLESFIGELGDQLGEADRIVNLFQPTGEGDELYTGVDGVVMETEGFDENRNKIRNILVYSPNGATFNFDGVPMNNPFNQIAQIEPEAIQANAPDVTDKCGPAPAANQTRAYEAIPLDQPDTAGELDIHLETVPNLSEEQSA